MIVSRVIRDRCRKSRALRLALLKSCVKQTANHRFMAFATFAKKLPRKVGAAAVTSIISADQFKPGIRSIPLTVLHYL